MDTRESAGDEALSPADFRLLDTRLVSIDAKRFEAPNADNGEGGATRARMDGTCPLPSQGDNEDVVVLNLKMELTGFQSTGREDADRSFSIQTEAEYMFKSKRIGFVKPAEAPRVIQLFILQAFPLQMERMRRIAQDMGFNGVDPDIGVPVDESEIFAGDEPQHDAPPIPVKKRSKSKKLS